ncbi:MAG: hypothetical protein ABJE95_36315 [Byssovorax sp.]
MRTRRNRPATTVPSSNVILLSAPDIVQTSTFYHDRKRRVHLAGDGIGLGRCLEPDRWPTLRFSVDSVFAHLLPSASMRTRNLNLLTLSDLKLGLDDLYDKRHKSLVSSGTGKSYEPMLAKRRTSIDALPAALLGGKPLAVELGEKDDLHDGLGYGIWHFTEAYVRNPRTPTEQLDAIKRIRAAFIPMLLELSASYATEAEAAIKRKPLLKTLKADLKMFPVAGGLTLLDWVTDFLDAGQSLHELLSNRADVDDTGRKDAGTLRTTTIGLLNRCRSAIADEVDDDSKLPRNLDQQVFAYFDELESMRAASLAATAAAAKAAKKAAAEKAASAAATPVEAAKTDKTAPK